MALSRLTTWAGGQVLTATALNAEFDNILNNPLSLISTASVAAKGLLLVGNGSALIGVSVGTDNQVLTADSTQASGVKWTGSANAQTPWATNINAAGYNLTNVNYLGILTTSDAFAKIESSNTANTGALLKVKRNTTGATREWWIGTGTASNDNFDIYDFTSGKIRLTIAPNGNVSIGGGNPDTYALLDLQSTTGAFLPPRMTTTQRDALTATDGMIIYNATTGALNYRKAGVWTAI